MSNIWYPGSPLPTPPVGGNVGITVPNIDTLRTVDPTQFPNVFVEGYRTPGDGGGGWYNYQSGDVTSGCVFTGSISGSVLTVTAVTQGIMGVGQRLHTNGIINLASGTGIASLGTGTGGPGTYNLYGGAQSITSQQMAADSGGNLIIGYDMASRWRLSIIGDVTYKQFGAFGNNANDDTPYMMAAHNAYGGEITATPGYYNFTNLIFAQGGIRGFGKGQSFLYCTDLGGTDAIQFTGANAGFTGATALFRDITVYASLSKTGGYGIAFTAGTEGYYSSIEDCVIENFQACVHLTNNAGFRLSRCDLINYNTTGVTIENQIVPDAGDSFIDNCTFNTGRVNGNTNAIYHRSSGGLKLTNNKILGCDFGYTLQWNQTSSANILFANNSIENFTTWGMYFAKATSAGQVGSVTITGNEVNGPSCIGFDVSGAVTLLSIVGNILNVNTQGGASGTALLLNTVSNFVVGPNVINMQQGVGCFGISVGAGSSNGKVLPQTFVGFANANCFVNGSSTTTYEEISQTFTGPSVTTSTAFGTLFTGFSAVTFPRPFKVAPARVDCNVTSGGAGAFAAYASAITTTGCNISLTGVTSGGVTAGAQILCSTVGGII